MKKSACNDSEEYESEKRYQTIFDVVPISILEYDFSDSVRYLKELKSHKIKNYKKYFEKNPDLLKKIISSVKLVSVNEEAIKLYNAANKEELIGNLGKHTTPESFETYSKVIEEYLKGKIYYECETVNKTLDGRLIDIILRVTFPGEKQLSKRAIVSVTEITERKKAEKLLRIQRDLGIALSSTGDLKRALSEILNATLQIEDIDGGGIYLVDRITGGLKLKVHKGLSAKFVKIVECYNSDAPETALAMSGKPIFSSYSDVAPGMNEVQRKEGLRAMAVIPIKHNDEVIAVLNLTSHTNDMISVTARNALETVAAQIGEVIVQRDIETELFESQERYRMIFDYVPVSIFEYEFKDTLALQDELKAKGIKDYKIYFNEHPEILTRMINLIRLTDVNEETLKLYEARTRQEFFEQYGKHNIPESIEIFRNTISAFMEGKTSYECETVNQTLSGKLIKILYRATFPDEKHLSTRALITVVDITQRKSAEEALRKSEAHLRDFLENVNELVQSVAPDGSFIYVNKAWKKTLGYTDEEISGITLFDITHPDSLEHCKELFQRVISGETVSNIEAVFVAKDGREILVEGNANCNIEDGKPISTRGIFHDVTEKKQMEEERIKINNLDSLGILAGGIAHDFNNILTAILGNISLAKTFLKPDDKIFSRLTKSENACFRAQDLTYQLLTFSRGGAPIRETASIREIIQESANFSLIGSNVSCEFSFADNLLPVNVDKGQISQVINNLIINADQAMPNGGVIEVKVENVSSRSIDILPAQPEKFVKISMKDSGIGIPEKYKSKLFDPYFTTKQKGSGLGLATAYAIIKKHEGFITVDSKVGAGATFNIFLPVPSEYIRIKEVAKKKPIDIPEKKVKILLMDDDPEVRNVVIAMLKFLGHETIVMCDGAEALETYKKAKDSGEPFEVVIMDLTVPGGMGGKEMMEKLLEIDPEVKAIVSSGYSNDPVLSDFKKYGFKGMITKPYQTKQLKEVLNEVIS